MRERLEDLGMLAERLRTLCDWECFKNIESKHDFTRWHGVISEDPEDYHRKLRHAYEELQECLNIAMGRNEE